MTVVKEFDALTDLPVLDTGASPDIETSGVMDRYFGKNADEDTPSESQPRGTAGGNSLSWKTIVVIIIVFVILTNPISCAIFKCIPYVGNNCFVFSTVLFGLILFAVTHFVK